MRRIIVLVALLGAACACGSSAASTTPHPIVFGVAGGNLAAYEVTIEPTGRIRSTVVRTKYHVLSRAKVASLSRLVRAAFASGLKSRLCPGTNPDFGSRFIHAYGRTVRVRGSCEPRFNRLWDTLARAVGLSFG
jgi:hypothetical protein